MLSIIIPTYNEENGIGETLRNIYKHVNNKNNIEVIVTDGGSTDNTLHVVKEFPVRTILSKEKSRAVQMNTGVSIARGNILYFLHADTFPPKNFDILIANAVKNHFNAGCFNMKFDYQHRFLQMNAWFTRFNLNAFRFGDQSLFVTKDIFDSCGKFDPAYQIFEDQEIIPRLRKRTQFMVIKNPVITSARKYVTYGIYKTQVVYFTIYLFYRLGIKQNKLLAWYKKLLLNNEP